MQSSQIPVKFPIPFANSAGAGFIRAIPQNPTGTVGQAALTTGFPPANFNPVAAGGVPPFGQDFNGLLNQISAWNQWVSAGGGALTFDATFSTAIGGYPLGAFLQAVGNPGHFWISLVENNTVNPDAGFTTNWLAFPNTLTTSRNFFVNGATGNDSYDGTSATFVSGTTGPWATLAKAASQIPIYNLNGFSITINVANGTYSQGSTILSWPAQNGSGSVIIQGNHASPSSVTISATTGTAMQFATGVWVLDGFTITSPTASSGDPANGFLASSGSNVITKAVNFGPCAGYHMEAGTGGIISPYGPITINSGANATGHILSSTNGSVNFASVALSGSTTLTVAGPVTFSQATATAVILSSINGFYYGGTTGGASVTGSRYLVQSNSVINSNGGGVNAFPGSVAGTTSSGGQYL